MRFGIVVPQHETDRDHPMRAAQLAREAGLHSLWVIDHLQGRPSPARDLLGGWETIALLAASIEEIQIGPLVSRVGIRPPRVVSAMARTIERIAPSRLIVGLGVGDDSSAEEHRAYGIGMGSLSERLERLDQTIQALRVDAPACRIWIGGKARALIERVPSADGWNFWGSVEEFAELRPQIELPEQIEVSWAGTLPTDTELRQLRDLDVAHVIVATGVKNYESRIKAVADLARKIAG